MATGGADNKNPATDKQLVRRGPCCLSCFPTKL